MLKPQFKSPEQKNWFVFIPFHCFFRLLFFDTRKWDLKLTLLLCSTQILSPWRRSRLAAGDFSPTLRSHSVGRRHARHVALPRAVTLPYSLHTMALGITHVLHPNWERCEKRRTELFRCTRLLRSRGSVCNVCSQTNARMSSMPSLLSNFLALVLLGKTV